MIINKFYEWIFMKFGEQVDYGRNKSWLSFESDPEYIGPIMNTFYRTYIQFGSRLM